MTFTPCRPLSRASLALILLTLAPAPVLAERIAPLAPPRSFDSLSVPLPPQRIEPPAVKVVPVPTPLIVPPGTVILTQPPVRLEKTQARTAPAPAESDAISQGLDALLDNVLREMQPTFDDMARGLDGARAKFGPALNELGDLVDDIGNYQAPERLPNGDILIRRRADAPPAPEVGPALRNLTTPRSGTASSPDMPAAGQLPETGATPATPTPPSAPPAAGDQPALANPIPAVPADPNQPKIDL